MISWPGKGLTGTGALRLGSDWLGSREGIEVEDSVRWVATADDGLVFVLVAARDGLMSCTLFFLDLPGPEECTDDALDFSGGRTGEDSLEA